MRAMTPYIVGTSTGMLPKLMSYIIAYCAVATSSSLNVVAMRKKELDEGIQVRNPKTDEDLGMSKKAA